MVAMGCTEPEAFRGQALAAWPDGGIAFGALPAAYGTVAVRPARVGRGYVPDKGFCKCMKRHRGPKAPMLVQPEN